MVVGGCCSRVLPPQVQILTKVLLAAELQHASCPLWAPVTSSVKWVQRQGSRYDKMFGKDILSGQRRGGVGGQDSPAPCGSPST